MNIYQSRDNAYWLVMTSPELKPDERFLMVVYIKHADEKRHAWPLVTTLKGITGFEPGKIIGMRRTLAKKGYLTELDGGEKWLVEIMEPVSGGHDETPTRRMIQLEGTHISMPEGSTLPGWDLNGKKIPEHFEKKANKGKEKQS